MSNTSSAANTTHGVNVFRFYLAGDASTSHRVLTNLYGILRKHFPECQRVELIDVLKEPRRALHEATVITPPRPKLSSPSELQTVDNSGKTNAVQRQRSTSQLH